MKFEKEVLLDLLYDSADKLVRIEDSHVESTRWSEFRRLVFYDEVTKRYFEVHYSQGLTEQQDEMPWEYEGQEIECFEVFPKDITKRVYEKNVD